MLIPLSLALAFAAGQSTEAPAPAGQSHFIMVAPDGPTRDADGDGFVSREEFMAPLAEAFGRLDKDGDGRLSEEERQSGQGQIRMRGPGPMAWRRDGPDGGERTVIYEREGNGPGRLTVNDQVVEGGGRVEILTADGVSRGPGHMIIRRGGHAIEGGERHTLTVDASDEDQAPQIIVNGREVEDGYANVIVRRMEGGPDGHHVIMRRPGPGGPTVFQGEGEQHEIFVHRMGDSTEGGLDKDGDGKVSEEEFLAPMREAFRGMDADHSGALDDGEHGRRDD